MHPNEYCHKCTEQTTLPPVIIPPVCTDGELCEEVVHGNCVKYTGPAITCLGITVNMSLNALVQAMASVICNCAQFTTTTTTVTPTTTTTTVIV